MAHKIPLKSLFYSLVLLGSFYAPTFVSAAVIDSHATIGTGYSNNFGALGYISSFYGYGRSIGQVIVPINNGNSNQISLWICKQGTVNSGDGNLTLKIYLYGGTYTTPKGTLLATDTNNFALTALTACGSGTKTTFTLDTSVYYLSGNSYYFELTKSGTDVADSSNHGMRWLGGCKTGTCTSETTDNGAYTKLEQGGIDVFDASAVWRSEGGSLDPAPAPYNKGNFSGGTALSANDMLFEIAGTSTSGLILTNPADSSTLTSANGFTASGTCPSSADFPTGSYLSDTIHVYATETGSTNPQAWKSVDTTCTSGTWSVNMTLWNGTFNLIAAEDYVQAIGVSQIQTIKSNIHSITVNVGGNTEVQPINWYSATGGPDTGNSIFDLLKNPFLAFYSTFQSKVPFRYFFDIQTAYEAASKTATTAPTITFAWAFNGHTDNLAVFDLSATETLIGSTSWNLLQTIITYMLWGFFIFYAVERWRSVFSHQ